jgi:hypothetical protein
LNTRKYTTIAAAAALALAGVLAGCGTTIVKEAAPAATTQPKQTVKPTPPKVIIVNPPASPAPTTAPVSSYAQDILNSGIVGPVSWINQTGQTLCSDWASGMTWAQTDSAVLTPGGIYPNHLALYDTITSADLCPAFSGGNAP